MKRVCNSNLFFFIRQFLFCNVFEITYFQGLNPISIGHNLIAESSSWGPDVFTLDKLR